MTQINIHFELPGIWDSRFYLTALWQDAAGNSFRHTWWCHELPADQLATLQGIIAGYVSMGEPWRAHLVRARLLTRLPASMAAAGVPEPEAVEEEYIALEVDVLGDNGGTRTYTPRDYPQLELTDAAAIAFFKYFTQS